MMNGQDIIMRFPCRRHQAAAGEPCHTYVTCTVTAWIVCSRRASDRFDARHGKMSLVVSDPDTTNGPPALAGIDGEPFATMNAVPR